MNIYIETSVKGPAKRLPRGSKYCRPACFKCDAEPLAPIWEKNGWKNARRKPVGNRHLWKRLKKLMDMHVVSVIKESHSCRKIYMADNIQKEMQREHPGGVERRKDV